MKKTIALLVVLAFVAGLVSIASAAFLVSVIYAKLPHASIPHPSNAPAGAGATLLGAGGGGTATGAAPNLLF